MQHRNATDDLKQGMLGMFKLVVLPQLVFASFVLLDKLI
jgi:hypothetical protein